MKTITDIQPQKNDKKRVNLYIDGAFYSGVEKIVLMTNNLNKGDEISEKKLEEIIEDSEYTSAFSKASQYILKGSHTKKQVIVYLKNKNYSGKIIYKVIDKLEGYGYLDDGQFAENYVDLKKHKHGKKLLEIELKNKGIGEETVRAALESIGDEDESAYGVAVKYVKGKPLDISLKQKCFRYVVSKGFSYDSAKYAIERIEREQNDF